MALIKCSECGKEISDKAVSCPHCGNPLVESSEEENVVTIQLTQKKWKTQMLIGLIVWLFGVVLFLKGLLGAGAGYAALGIFTGLVGFTTIIAARVGAWWTSG